ncbi:MAG: hypothetical protein ISR50_11415 [Alphaproteobacteria bacterium]|nr:hypothetical protein [Alphaproteobacteria bacterium]MBL6953236.1 hypothetical protein [Alphaproteobacteria bacterium]
MIDKPTTWTILDFDRYGVHGEFKKINRGVVLALILLKHDKTIHPQVMIMANS